MARLEDEYSKEAYQNAIAQVTANKQPQEGFTYDVNADPLYQQYKDQYIQNGKLAMKDTMGQAAALTGGYDSTYSQQVGQQAYDGYLQNLTAMIPELYGQAYNRQQTEYSKIYNMIGQTGYNPTDAELAAAGMTRAQANALKAMWTRTYAPVATGGGGGSSPGGSPPPNGGDKTAYQVGVDIAKAYGTNATAAYAAQDKTGLTKEQQKSIYQGIVDTQKLAFLDK